MNETHINKARVGAFVLSGVALLVLALIALGSSKFFSNNSDYVLYFDGSVSGLSVGAPVVFRGVPLGNVTRISLVANPGDETVTIPVYIRIDEDNIEGLNEKITTTDAMREAMLRRMIQRGLRARLQLQSIITGQYRVELDFFPDTPIIYHSTNTEDEIPTIPSPLDALQRTLGKLPFEEMATAVSDVLHGVARVANSEDLYQSLAAIRATFESANKLITDIAPMREDLRRALNGLGNTATTIDTQLPEAVGAFQVAMGGLAAAAVQMERTLASADTLVSRDSRTVRELNKTLVEFNEAARAVRNLATLLERHPEALLLGKGGKKQ